MDTSTVQTRLQGTSFSGQLACDHGGSRTRETERFFNVKKTTNNKSPLELFGMKFRQVVAVFPPRCSFQAVPLARKRTSKTRKHTHRIKVKTSPSIPSLLFHCKDRAATAYSTGISMDGGIYRNLNLPHVAPTGGEAGGLLLCSPPQVAFSRVTLVWWFYVLNTRLYSLEVCWDPVRLCRTPRRMPDLD